MASAWEKIQQGLRRPHRFVGRQLYRLVIILPYEIVVAVVAWVVEQVSRPPEPTTETCVFISSLIYVKDRKLTYGVRSVFKAETRADQTLRTIQAVRQHMPGAKIVLVEAGLRRDIPEAIIQAVDTYLYVGDRAIVRRACDSPFKSLGETVMLLSAAGSLPAAKRYFKMSGRYWLNDEFKPEAWQGSDLTFYYIRPDFISTRLYSFTARARAAWRWALIKSLPYLMLDYPIEFLLPKFTSPARVSRISRVGVSGLDGVSGVEVKE